MSHFTFFVVLIRQFAIAASSSIPRTVSVETNRMSWETSDGAPSCSRPHSWDTSDAALPGSAGKISFSNYEDIDSKLNHLAKFVYSDKVSNFKYSCH